MKKLAIKNILILFIVFSVIMTLSIVVILDHPDLAVNDTMQWIFKEKDIENRLLSIPIVLYHNIDGKGAFSISSDVLRSHFEIIKNAGFHVISLADLVKRLEKPSNLNEAAMVITFDDGFYSMYSKLLPLVKEYNFPITLFVYANAVEKQGRKAVTWELLRILDSAGIAVESHTISHADLVKLSDKKDLESRHKLFEEIYLSKRVLELYLNKKITLFAFPYGRYNLDLIDLCRHSGYTRVFSTDYGSNIVTRDNYCLKRHHIKKDYSLDFFISLIK